MNLKDILSSDAVHYLNKESSKRKLLQFISQQAEKNYGINSTDVLNALNEREELGSTGVGHGVAIPHARFETLDKVYGIFIRLEKSINFDSIDRQPVDLIFTILAPKKEGAAHLKALALVSRTLRSKQNCIELRSNMDENTLFALLTKQDSTQAA